jgi:hypothetical protein
MSERPRVKYEAVQKVYKRKISFEQYEFVADPIERIKSNTQFSMTKDSKVTLCTPSEAPIDVDVSPSPSLPENSSENPLRIQITVDSKPALDDSKPAPDANLTLFWNSLHHISKKDGFLHFTVIPEFFPGKFKALYIRKAYEDLFKIICRNLVPADPEERFRGMAITGT